MDINAKDVLKVLDMLSKTANARAMNSKYDADAFFWGGINIGLETAKHVIIYGKPPQTEADKIIAKNINGSTLK